MSEEKECKCAYFKVPVSDIIEFVEQKYKDKYWVKNNVIKDIEIRRDGNDFNNKYISVMLNYKSTKNF